MKCRVKGTNTILLITKEDLPASIWKDVTSVRIEVSYHPEKSETNRFRLTVGGNHINYPENCGTPTANMLAVKLLLNSVISTKGEKLMSVDIKYF